MPLPPEPQTLDEIRDWHDGILDALFDQRASALRAIAASSAVQPRFVGMRDDDVEAYFDVQRRELDRLTVLNLVASAEATLRLDYFRRVASRLKDPLAVAYRNWHKDLSPMQQRRPAFDDGGILDVLRESNAMANHIIGQYRECLRARHWVGHGRYWAKPVEVDQLDPNEVYARADALLRALP